MRTFEISKVRKIIAVVKKYPHRHWLVQRFIEITKRPDLQQSIESVQALVEGKASNRRHYLFWAVSILVLITESAGIFACFSRFDLMLLSLVVLFLVFLFGIMGPLDVFFKVKLPDPGIGDGIVLDFAAYMKRVAEKMSVSPAILADEMKKQFSRAGLGVNPEQVIEEVYDEMKNGEGHPCCGCGCCNKL